MTGTPVLASGGTNFTAISITLGIIFIIAAAIAVIVWSYFRLQRHRVDAVAMAHDRRLAEEAVANQQELRAQLAELTAKVAAVEQLMRPKLVPAALARLAARQPAGARCSRRRRPARAGAGSPCAVATR
jgi:uncharacterized protein YqfA (UPF0365 family)